MPPRISLVAPIVLLVAFATVGCGQDDARATTAPSHVLPARCPAAKVGRYEAMAVIPKIAPRATFANVTVCVSAAASLPSFASYQGSLAFDSTAAAVDTIVEHGGGMRTANGNMAGVVRFAGAGVQGFASGPMLTVRLRLRRPGKVPAIALTLSELSSPSGASLVNKLWVQGRPATAARIGNAPKPTITDTAPRLIRLDPESVGYTALGNGEIVMVTVRGANFHPTRNVLVFGPVRVTNVRSDSGGTILRFSLPILQPTGGDAPPMALPPNDYLITVENARGKSNALRFRIAP